MWHVFISGYVDTMLAQVDGLLPQLLEVWHQYTRKYKYKWYSLKWTKWLFFAAVFKSKNLTHAYYKNAKILYVWV